MPTQQAGLRVQSSTPLARRRPSPCIRPLHASYITTPTTPTVLCLRRRSRLTACSHPSPDSSPLPPPPPPCQPLCAPSPLPSPISSLPSLPPLTTFVPIPPPISAFCAVCPTGRDPAPLLPLCKSGAPHVCPPGLRMARMQSDPPRPHTRCYPPPGAGGKTSSFRPAVYQAEGEIRSMSFSDRLPNLADASSSTPRPHAPLFDTQLFMEMFWQPLGALQAPLDRKLPPTILRYVRGLTLRAFLPAT